MSPGAQVIIGKIQKQLMEKLYKFWYMRMIKYHVVMKAIFLKTI